MLHFFVAFQCFDSEFCRFSSEARVYKKKHTGKELICEGWGDEFVFPKHNKIKTVP